MYFVTGARGRLSSNHQSKGGRRCRFVDTQSAIVLPSKMLGGDHPNPELHGDKLVKPVRVAA
jgi:hypothetical protein